VGVFMNEKADRSFIYWLFVTIISALIIFVSSMVFHVSFDSLNGGVMLGFILFLYLCWFIYDTFESVQNISLARAVKFNLKKNNAVIAMYFYWAVFMAFPVLILFFSPS
jgi:membrane-bound acyltransferase YfiQ involved in biofilm formation